MAVLLAVGLKYFLVEAYEIPTPSMQPTLMGSSGAGIYDRILVNKAIYLLREPERWDVAVFRFPLNLSQNYVKRIVGMPGDRLRIRGGNIYQVIPGDGRPPTYRILRKPEELQEFLWKRTYPVGNQRGSPFDTRSGTGSWRRSEDGVIARDNGAGARIAFSPEGGTRDYYWHGYPDHIARALMENRPPQKELHLVGDLRWSLTVVPDAQVERIWLEQTETPEYGKPRRFRLGVIRGPDGKATASLELFEGSPGKLAAHKELEGVRFEQDRPIRLILANVDARLLASVDGRDLEPIDYEALPSSLGGLKLHLGCKGGQYTRFLDPLLERDIFYTNDGVQDEVVEIPEGHYWMLGDNTQNSSDGRMWTELEILVDASGRLANPYSGSGTQLVGNDRRLPALVQGRPPMVDPDENPVFLERTGQLVFTDYLGEEHVIRGSRQDFEQGAGVIMRDRRFVPREDLIGRALATFWPANPLGNFRLGLIR